MAILPILCYPDPRLHKVAQPVQAVDERIQTLVADMLATMYDAQVSAWPQPRWTCMSAWW